MVLLRQLLQLALPVLILSREELVLHVQQATFVQQEPLVLHLVLQEHIDQLLEERSLEIVQPVL